MKKNEEFLKAEFNHSDFITIPNFVTLFRLLLLPFILVLLSSNKPLSSLWALILMGISGFSDVLDGFLANILNQISSVGKILDPIVDKISIISIIAFLVVYHKFPVWAFVLIIIRELLIICSGGVIIKKYDVIPSSNILGKIAVVLIGLSIVLYTADFVSIESSVINKQNILILGMVMLGISSINYGLKVYRFIKKTNGGIT